MTQYKKFFVTAASAALVVSAVAPASAADVKFADISQYSQSVQDEIISLAEAGIINGTSDTTFSPARNITRGQVVKLLGRFLVKEGYATIPTDWETKQRFKDIRLDASDKDLIMNAAIVYDAGVFQGSNGNLISYQPISRENMALVLDRAAEKILGQTLIELAKEQEKEGNVTDLNKAKTEARAAISAINALGISNVATFNPKGNVTRANFVSFLHRAFIKEEAQPPVVLTLKDVKVVSATELTAELSDGSLHNVVLETPLVDNEATEVSFKINDVTYKATVTHVVADLKVSSVVAKNGTQLEVKFNQEVKDLGDITIRGIDTNNAVVTVKDMELSANKKSAIITVEDVFVGRYAVVVENFKTAAGVDNVSYDEIINVAPDKTAPTIVGTERPYANRVIVNFSEPLSNIGTVTLKLADGSSAVAVAELIGNKTAVEFDLSSEAIPPNAKVTATFVGTADVAGNLISPNPASVTFEKGSADGVPPTIAKVEQLSAKSFTVTLSEPVRAFTAANIAVSRASAANAVTAVEKLTDTQYKVTVTNVLDGLNTIVMSNVEDLSGEKAASATTTATFAVDKTAPVVSSTAIIVDKGHQYLTIKFNKPVTLKDGAAVTVNGTYVQNAVTNTLVGKDVAVTRVDAETVRVKLSDIAENNTGAAYDVSLGFKNIVSEADVAAEMVNSVTFARGEDVSENTTKVEVDDIVIVDNNTIEVIFTENVDAATATTASNYTIDSAKVERVVVLAGALNKAILTLQADSVEHDGTRYISVANIKAAGSSAVMDNYRQTITLTENVTPKVSNVEILTDNQLKVTFSEAVHNVGENAFIVAEGDKVFAGAKTTTSAAESTQFVTEAVITLAEGDSFASKSTVRITVNPNAGITDGNRNALQFSGTNVTIQ